MGKELLFSVTKKDLDISYFSGKGAGGQHRNRHNNCVRIIHRPSGAIATGQSYREKRKNMIEALRGIANNEKFLLWCKLMAAGLSDLDREVDEEMKNIKVEIRRDGRWVEDGKG